MVFQELNEADSTQRCSCCQVIPAKKKRTYSGCGAERLGTFLRLGMSGSREDVKEAKLMGTLHGQVHDDAHEKFQGRSA